MIQTREFAITKGEYFKIILLMRFRKQWWLYAITLIMALVFYPDFGKDSLSTFFVVYAIVLIPLTIIYLYSWSHSEKNKVVFLTRKFTIDEEKITGIVENDASSEVPLKYIVKIVELKMFWLLYISKSQFLFIDKNAFESDNDRDSFETLIKKVNRSLS